MILITLFLCSVSVWLGSVIVLACLAGFHWSLHLCAVAVFPGYSIFISDDGPNLGGLPHPKLVLTFLQNARLWALEKVPGCDFCGLQLAAHRPSTAAVMWTPWLALPHLFVHLLPSLAPFPCPAVLVTKATWAFPHVTRDLSLSVTPVY